MRAKPWMVVNVMTNEVVGWYTTDTEAFLAHKGEPIDVSYKPGRKGKGKK